MTPQCWIISGGSYSPLPEIPPGDYVIACDKGYQYAKESGVMPQLLVGDFDSYRGDLPEEVATIRLPREKDDTDTRFAIKHAMSLGFTKIQLTCALGGRLDHTLANLQSCAAAAEQGVAISIVERETRIYFLHNGQLTLERVDGWIPSVFALSNCCTGVSILGTKYELHNVVLKNSDPLGVSNEWREPAITVQVKNGTVMIVCTHLEEEA